jgi:hypothetical protein
MAAETPSLADPAARTPSAALDWPGLRTFRSARFRLALALTVWLLGSVILGTVLIRQAADPAGQYAFDFQVYDAAAARLAAGDSPYGPQMFEGPVPAQGVYEGIFKYPPLFAQLLVPLTALDFWLSAGVWLAIQTALILVGVWIAARAGGAPRTFETVCWCGAAATLFLPNFDTVWKGNVSGGLAFLVALSLAGGLRGGLGVASAVLLKTTPVVMLPAALSGGRRSLLGLAVLTPVVGLSVLISPGAWFDFVRVLPNLVSGPAQFATNLSPDNLVSYALPALPLAAEIVRWLGVGMGVLAVIGSVMVARRPGGWPAAVVLGVAAMLLLPSATWYHYLAVLLPLAAYAWPRAGRRSRFGLAAGAAAVSLALPVLPLAVAGAGLMLGSALSAVWPHQRIAHA